MAVYGRNLTDEVVFGGDFPLPGIAWFEGPGASFSPIQKGGIYGAGVIYNFRRSEGADNLSPKYGSGRCSGV